MATVPSMMEAFRESHHAIARMYAAGLSDMLVSRTTGYSMRRLSIIRNTPAFEELVAYYSEIAAESWKDHMDVYNYYLHFNRIAAERHITETIEDLEDRGERLPVLTANKISIDRADRTGYSKTSKVDVKIDFGTALDRAIVKSNEAKVIEGKAVALPATGTNAKTPSHESSSLTHKAPAKSIPLAPRPEPSHPAKPAKPDFAKILAPSFKR